MADDGRRATSADVAREAGVSRATVSYVLNDSAPYTVAEETAARVRAAAARLGYAPSAAARMLRRGRSELVLCLLPDFPIGPTLGGFLWNLSDAFTDRGLTFVIHPVTDEPIDLDRLWTTVSPAALIALRAFLPVEVDALGRLRVPVAEVVYGSVHHSLPKVTLPNREFGHAQAEHLVERSHSRIGYAYPVDERLDVFARARLDGVQAVLAAGALPPAHVRDVELTPSSAAAAIRAWRDAGVTAVCAYNDEVALALIGGMHDLGLAVPADLAIVGVDDIPAAAFSDPPLGTVRLDHRPYAEGIADLVVAAIDGESDPDRVHEAPVELVARNSA